MLMRAIAAALALFVLTNAASAQVSPGQPGFLPTCSSVFAVNNWLLQSQTFTTSPWATAGNVVAAPTVTANSTTAPDSTTTASTLALPAVSGANAQSVLSQSIALTASYPVTFDIYVKGAVGGEHLWLSSITSGTAYARTSITATTSWARYSLTFVPGLPADTTITRALQVGIDLHDPSQSSQAAQTVYIWGAQLVSNQIEQTYIPTTTAASATQNQTVNCPPGVAFRDFSPLTQWSVSPYSSPTTGNYGKQGVGIPRFEGRLKIGSTYYVPTSCTGPADQDWHYMCLWSGTSISTLSEYVAANPILTSVASTWEDFWILHGTIAPSGCGLGTYCLYYGAMAPGTPSTGVGAIGIATSTNGTSWTKYSGNPVITATQVANAKQPNLPSIVQIGSTYYMYAGYNCTAMCGSYIVYWTSPASDGVNWTFGGPTLLAPIPGDWDYSTSGTIYILDPHVIANKNGFYEMIYTTYATNATLPGGYYQQLGYGVSADGKSWWKYQPAPIVKQGTPAFPTTQTWLGSGLFYEDGTTFWVGFDVVPDSNTGSWGYLATMPDNPSVTATGSGRSRRR